MSISRKMRVHVEAKIRHAVVTGSLPHLERPSSEARPKQDLNKDDGASQSK